MYRQIYILLIIFLSLASNIIYANNLDNGLLAYYPFNGNTNDASGNENNAILDGATSCPDRFGNEHSAFDFDGINDKITTPLINSVHDALSLCVWYKVRYDGDDANLISSRSLDDGGYNYSGIDVTNNPGNSVLFLKSYGDGVQIVDESFRNDQWHFVVGTYDGNTMNIYGDGTLLDTKQTNGLVENLNNYIIGFDNSANNTYFDGVIDEVRIYNRALSENEIDSLYHLNGWANTPPVAICNNIEVDAGNNCNIEVNPEQLDNGSYDPDGDEITISINPPGPFPIGQDTVMFIVSDAYASDSCSAIITVTGGTGEINGFVMVDSIGLENVKVTLNDTTGSNVVGFDTLLTDGTGFYEFNNVPAGIYLVEIIEPLGYAPMENPIIDTLESCEINEIDFDLVQEVVENNSKPAIYWSRQFRKNIKGIPKVKETKEDLLSYIEDVQEHYTPHYNFFKDDSTLNNWLKKLRLWSNLTKFKKARRQLAALVLNMVSDKVGQYTIVTEDNRTAGDVLTYVSDLLDDDDNSNDKLAKKLARKVNCRRLISAGIIPKGDILYKGNKFRKIDYGFNNSLKFVLYNNFPNPFNPSTNISFDLPKDEKVRIEIFNSVGQKVDLLLNNYMDKGSYKIVWDAKKFASGVYYYRIIAGKFTDTGKMLLTK